MPKNLNNWMSRIKMIGVLCLVVSAYNLLMSIVSTGRLSMDTISGWVLPHVGIIIFAMILVFLLNDIADYFQRQDQGESVFAKIDALELPKRMQKFIDRHVPELDELGFDRISCYRSQQRLTFQYMSYFLHAEKFVIVNFFSISTITSHRFYSFASIFDDGTYLESTTVRPWLLLSSRMEQIIIESHAGASITELYHHHTEAIQRIERERECRVLELSSDQLPQVAEYVRRIIHLAVLGKPLEDELPLLPGRPRN